MSRDDDDAADEEALLQIAREAGANVPAVARTQRLRVLQDRLWDDKGHEWFNPLGRWASRGDTEGAMSTAARCVVHGHGRPFRVLDGDLAQQYWHQASKHFETPGGSRSAAKPDGDGITYAAQIWTRNGDALVGFVEFC